MNRTKCGGLFGAVVTVAVLAVFGVSGCLRRADRAHKRKRGWTTAPMVHVVTKCGIVTKVVPGEPGQRTESWRVET
jgi:hypothetical protein